MAGAALTDRGAAIKTMGGFSHMDIRILGLLNDIAAQNSISSYTGGVSSLSFPQVFSDVTGINQMSVNDLFSALFPTNSVNVKVGNCSVAAIHQNDCALLLSPSAVKSRLLRGRKKLYTDFTERGVTFEELL